MKFTVCFALILFSSPMTQAAKEVRGPSGVSCEVLFQNCVKSPTPSQQVYACGVVPAACANRLNEESKAEYERLSAKCSRIEKTRGQNGGKIAADFCRATLMQYIISE